MAGLIPQNFIDDLLSRANIVDVIDKRVSLKKTGKNYTACCPFHNEKSPSFSVEPEKQFFYCFGCGEGGNVLGFIMKFDSVDFPQAIEILAQEYGLDVPREESPAQKKNAARLSEIHDTLLKSNAFYQEQLRSHKNRGAAIEYLKRRGVSGEIARDFNLGFAPEGWDNLSSRYVGSPKGRENLLKAGLVVDRKSKDNDNTFYDRFRNRIMFPIRDSRGRTVAFGGRVLGDEKPKYLNSPETLVFQKGTELYGLYEAKKHKEIKSNNIIEKVEKNKKIIGIGETGLDFYYNHSEKKDQINSFLEHIDASQKTKLPLIVHTRSAEDDTLKILKKAKEENDLKILIHCFTGTKEFAFKLLDIGAYISASGIVTFKKSKELAQTFKEIPINRILVETDSPYLAPEPLRGKTNEPSYITHTVRFLSDLKNISYEKFSDSTTQNFFNLFGKLN